MTTTNKQKLQAKYTKIYEIIGIKKSDAKILGKLTNSDAILNLNKEYLQKNFKDKYDLAIRRSVCSNVVVYGPHGFVVIEQQKITHAHKYNEKQIKTNFYKMTRNFDNFVIHQNLMIKSLLLAG